MFGLSGAILEVILGSPRRSRSHHGPFWKIELPATPPVQTQRGWGSKVTGDPPPRTGRGGDGRGNALNHPRSEGWWGFHSLAKPPVVGRSASVALPAKGARAPTGRGVAGLGDQPNGTPSQYATRGRGPYGRASDDQISTPPEECAAKFPEILSLPPMRATVAFSKM